MVLWLPVPQACFRFDKGGALPVPGSVFVLQLVFLAGGTLELRSRGSTLSRRMFLCAIGACFFGFA